MITYANCFKMVPKKCVLCSSWCSNYRSLSFSCFEWFYEYLRSNGMVFDKNDLHICSSCVGIFYGIKETMNSLSVVEPMDVADESSTFDDEDRLTLDNIIFARSGHTRCVICRLEKPSGMVVMPKACSSRYAYSSFDVRTTVFDVARRIFSIRLV